MKLFKTLAWCLCFLAFAVNAEDPRPMTIDDIGKMKSVGSAEISPNGQHIAFTRSKPRTPYKDKDGRPWVELYVADTKGNERPFITGKVNISGIQWSADSKRVYFLTKRGEDKHRTLYAIPVDGGEAQRIYGHKNGIASYAIDDTNNRILFVAKDEKPKHKKKLTEKGFKAEVYEEDIQYSHLWMVVPGEGAKAEKIELEGNVRSIDVSQNGKQWLVQTSETPLIDDVYMKASLHVISAEDHSVEYTVPHVGKLGAASISPDSKNIAFIGSDDIHDPSAGRLRLVKMGADASEELLPDYKGHIRGIEWKDNDDLIYLSHKGTETLIGQINIRSKKPKAITKEGLLITSRLSLADDGKKMALVASTPSHPREVFYQNGGKKPVRISESNPILNNIQLAEQSTYEHKARDGMDLQGILIKPLNYEPGKKYPLILFVHGGPEAHVSNGWITNYSRLGQVAAAQGYVAFYPNYRGSTGRGVEFSKHGQGHYAEAEFNDLVDAKDALVKDGLVDADKVGITGGSYGGYASAWAATALSEHFAASVMFVGISNQLSKFGTTDIPNEMNLVHSRAWPWERWQWMLEQSPIYHVEKAQTPILILHGKEDTRVHPSQSMELYRYLKTLGKVPVRLVFYPGEGHGNRKAAAQLDYSMRLSRWMDHYLKGPGGEPPEYDLKHQDKLDQDKKKKD